MGWAFLAAASSSGCVVLLPGANLERLLEHIGALSEACRVLKACAGKLRAPARLLAVAIAQAALLL